MTEIEVWRRRPLEARMLVWTGENLEQMFRFTGGLFRVPVDGRWLAVPAVPVRTWSIEGAGIAGFASDEGRLCLDSGIAAQVYDKLHKTWINVTVGQRIVEGRLGEFYPVAPEALEGDDALYERVS